MSSLFLSRTSRVTVRQLGRIAHDSRRAPFSSTTSIHSPPPTGPVPPPSTKSRKQKKSSASGRASASLASSSKNAVTEPVKDATPPPSASTNELPQNTENAATPTTPSPGAQPTSSSTSDPNSPPTPPEATTPIPPAPASGPTAILPTLDFSASGADGFPQGRTGAKSARESLSTIERRRRFMGRVGLAFLGLGLIGGYFYQGREWENGEPIPQGKENAGLIGRANARVLEVFDYFNKPAWKELLPPPLPPPHTKRYTLLLSLDDLLITSLWDREHGWRTAKRPGVDYFIGYLSQFYEIVVFTSQAAYTAIPILEKIDPFTLYISYKLFRESTRSVDGKLVKDLSYLNRDLSKVVAVDTVAERYDLQPDNAIIVPKWKGDAETKAGLVGLIPFLESIAIHRPEDVRPILKAYAGKDISVEYAKKEAELKQKFIEEWERNGGSKSAVGGVTLSGLFSSSTRPTAPKGGPPLTYLEQKRLEAQEFYKQEQAYFKSQEAYFQKMIDEDRERQTKEMSGSLFGMLTGQTGPAAVLAKLEDEKREKEEKEAAATASATKK